jgi:hypothetical protein
MFNIVNDFESSSNQWLNLVLLCFALIRIYLEIIQFDFASLPITKGMFKTKDEAKKFHRSGLYFCVGYIVLSAPFTLFS